MKHSSYLDWYIHVPKVKYDFRSSGVSSFRYDLNLGEVDLSVNYAYGNPETADIIARRYDVEPENVFISSEGTSGQNTRLIRYIARQNKRKNEAIVEYPTYEPLLRKAQEYFPRVKRLERKEHEDYCLDAAALQQMVSDRTGLLVITNPHAPSGAARSENNLTEIMEVAHDHGFYVLCDEIYAEFSRNTIPPVFSIDPDFGIVTTSFTKAYGLGGLKLGVALAKRELVHGLYTDVLNTVGNSPNVVQLITLGLLSKNLEKLERHKLKWQDLKGMTEEWLSEKGLEYFPNATSITYWVNLSIDDTHKWVTEHTISNHSLAVVPGAFFLFKHGYKLPKSNKIRLGLGNINPEKTELLKALGGLERALES